MDTVDVSIVRELFYPGPHQWNPRESWATIARNLGIDEETVRTRIRRLEADGVIGGWDLLVNPSVLDRMMHQVIVTHPPGQSRGPIIERLRVVDGLYWVFENLNPTLGVVAYVPPNGGIERFRQLVAMAADGDALHAPFAIPPATVRLEPADWRLVRVLRQDPRLPFEEAARALGVSEKTVRRRLQRLVEGRAIFLNGHMDFTRMRGLVPVQAKVWLQDDAARPAVEACLMRAPNRTFFNFGSRVPQLSFAAESVAEIERMRAELAAIPGVERAWVEILVRRTRYPEWLDDEIRRRAES